MAELSLADLAMGKRLPPSGSLSLADLAQAHDPFNIGATAMSDDPWNTKMGRIASAVGGGLKAMIEAPGRAMQEGITTEQAVNWAAPTSLGMLGLSRIPGVASEGTLGMFAGPKSKSWDASRAAEATSGGGWRETGYGDRFADKRMRTEIPDADAKVFAEFNALPPNQSRELSQVLQHPALYEAYPDLAKVKVKRSDQSGATVYDPRTNTITVPRGTQTREALLHEVQHKIDDIEGFSRGASVGEFVMGRNPNARDAYRNTAGEVNARLTEARSDMSPSQLRERAPWDMFDVPLEQQVHRGTTADQQRAARNALIKAGMAGTAAAGLGASLIQQLGGGR
jgi:hypothetical protein